MSKTRIFSLLLVLMMVLSSTVLVFANAEGETNLPKPWEGDVATEFADGTGTEKDPFQIKTAEQLALMRDLVNQQASYVIDDNQMVLSSKLEGATVIDWFVPQSAGGELKPMGIVEYQGAKYFYNGFNGEVQQIASYQSADYRYFYFDSCYYTATNPANNKEGQPAFLYNPQNCTFVDANCTVSQTGSSSYNLSTGGSFKHGDAANLLRYGDATVYTIYLDGVSDPVYVATSAYTYVSVDSQISTIQIDGQAVTFVNAYAHNVSELRHFNEAYYRLDEDIVLNTFEGVDTTTWKTKTWSNVRKWSPIGTGKQVAFSGHFDGNGKTISGLYYTSGSGTYADGNNLKSTTINSPYGGLFGYVANATIENLKLGEGYVHQSLVAGSLVGAAVDSTISGIINQNTNVRAFNNTGHALYYGEAGGIIGDLQGSSVVYDCHNAGVVYGDSSGANKGVGGGIVGRIFNIAEVGTYVYGCTNSGTISSYAGHNGNGNWWSISGGIVGLMEYGNVSGCINTGYINPIHSGNTISAGGIVGRLHTGKITSCINIGDVYAKAGSAQKWDIQAGGIVGYMEGKSTTIGSLVENCFNKGVIRQDANTVAAANERAGMMAGYVNNYCTIKNNYYLLPDSEAQTVIGLQNTKGITIENNNAITQDQYLSDADSGVVAALNTYVKATASTYSVTFKPGTQNIEIYNQYATPYTLDFEATEGGSYTPTYPTTSVFYNEKTYAEGSAVSLTATANEGYLLYSIILSVNGEEQNLDFDENGVCRFLVPEGNATITVNFVEVKQDVKMTVTFVDYDGSILKIEEVNQFAAATAPAAPTRDGYRFIGWDTEDFYEVAENMTVTAQYVKLWTVTFVDINGNKLKSEVLDEGSNATAPQAPVVEGYRFDGWDVAFDNVTSDLVVTATYVKIWTVTFIGFNGAQLKSEILDEGSAAIAPDVPATEGFRFDRWDVAFDSIVADTTVTAVYVKTWTVTYLDIHGEAWKIEVYDDGAVPSFPFAPIVEGFIFEKWSVEASALVNDIVVASVYSAKPSSTAGKDYTVMHWTLGNHFNSQSKLQAAVDAAGNPDIIIVNGPSSSVWRGIELEGYSCWAYGLSNNETYEISLRYMGGGTAIYYKTDEFTPAGELLASHYGVQPRDYAYIIYPLQSKSGLQIPVVVAADGAGTSSTSRPNYTCENMLASLKTALGTAIDTAIIRVYYEPTSADSGALKDRLTTEPDENGFAFTCSDAIMMSKDDISNGTAYYTYLITYSKNNPVVSASPANPVAITADTSENTLFPTAQCFTVAQVHTVSVGATATEYDEYVSTKFNAASVTLQDNLLVNFKVNADKLAGKELLKAIVTIGGKTYEIAVGEVVNGNYVFSVPVAPHQMNEQIEIQLVFAHDLVGEWGGILTRYSVANYCYNKLESAEGEFRALLVSILNYGAAAQVAVGHDVENLANAKLSDADKLVVNGEINASSTQTEVSEDHSALWSAAGLVLSDKIIVRFAFEAENITGLRVNVVLNGHTYVIESKDFVHVSGNSYYVYIEGLSAHQLRDELKVTLVGQDGNVVSSTLTYSVAVYATKVLAHSEDTSYAKLVQLVKAMMAYGDAAYAYKY